MNDIKHLYGRAGFGLSPDEWTEKKNWSIKKAVNELFTKAKAAPMLTLPPNAFVKKPSMMQMADKEKMNEMRKEERLKVLEVNCNWVHRMGDPKESALLERMCLFWHGHFACQSKVGKIAAQQLNTIRKYALGSFKDLVVGIAKDPSMIRFLNNQQNRKQEPNENFARELMELFTLGRGLYNENDIKEAARAFTGWSSTTEGDYIFRSKWHDDGIKTFFGKTGKFGGEDIIDMILEKTEAADFITRKIYRYFVNQKEDPVIIKKLSKTFYDSDYNIGLLMRTIFESDWFYAEKNKGNKIKSPVDLLVGIMRVMNLKFTERIVPLSAERSMGQVLFNPPNVAGWEGGKTWIDNSTLMVRLNMALVLMAAANFEHKPYVAQKEIKAPKGLRSFRAEANIKPLLKLLPEGNDREKIIYALSDYFFSVPTKVDWLEVKRYSPMADINQFVALASARLMSMPEYQLC